MEGNSEGISTPEAEYFGGRFILALNNAGTDGELAIAIALHNGLLKARYVAQGHRDMDKSYMVHNITNLRQSSTRIIVSVAAIKGFRIFSHDVTQAYFQSEEKLTPQVFLLPKKTDVEHFGLSQDEIVELMRPIYSMTDAGDHWGVTIDHHAKDDLGLVPLLGDPSLYIKRNDEDLDGLLGMCVDDGCLAGDKVMQSLTELTLQRFDSRPREWDNFEFFGTSIFTVKNGHFLVSQKAYINRLKPLLLDASLELFRTYRATLAWVGYTRPDALCAINKSAQVTPSTFGAEKIKSFNTTIKHLQKTPERCLQYAPLDKSTLHLRVYAEASFAGNDDLSSQLGFIILLCDKENRSDVLDYSSRKSRRVVRSIHGGEVYAFADGFDRAYILRHDLQMIFKKKIPLHVFTDSLQMFDLITKGSTTEKG